MAKFGPHALHPGTIQGKEGIKYCHLATLVPTQCGHLMFMFHQANRLRALFYKALLRQEVSWYDKNGSGSFAEQLSQ